MIVKHRNGRTEYGPNVSVELTGEGRMARFLKPLAVTS
jgi:hypothetical protein